MDGNRKSSMMEKIFGTSLNRLETVYDLIKSDDFDKLDAAKKERIRNLSDRLEYIIAEIFYKRSIEPKVIQEIRTGYIDFNKDVTFLTYDKYGFCEELWRDYWILVEESFFENLFKATKQREFKNIEDKNLKLF